MIVMDKRLLTEFGCLDPIYVDGIAGTGCLGKNFATYYFRWIPKYAENGQVIYERTPALFLIRPRDSMICTIPCDLKNWIDGGHPPPTKPNGVPSGLN